MEIWKMKRRKWQFKTNGKIEREGEKTRKRRKDVPKPNDKGKTMNEEK